MRKSWTEPVPLSRTTALAIATIVAIVAALIAGRGVLPPQHADIDQLWFGARALMDGKNPYDVIGPGREFDYHWQLYYPLQAVVVVTPLALTSLRVTQLVMAAIGSGVLAYVVARSDGRGLVLFLSRAFYANALYVQWTPLLVAMWFVPALTALVAVKPTIGLAMLLGVKDWRAVRWGFLIAVGLTLVALVVQPSWPGDWLTATQSNTHIRPWVTVPGGPLLLLALIRWRRWEARLLAAFALVPQTFHPLATLPLVLLPGSLVGKATIAALTYLPSSVIVREPFGSRLASASPEDIFSMLGTIVLWTVLVPTLLFVLRLPNEGAIPSWMERLVARWPVWIRGRSARQHYPR